MGYFSPSRANMERAKLAAVCVGRFLLWREPKNAKPDKH